ncbi:cation-dependent mannose-6-phosphate receptor-like [Oratosquilla oratoria]|uniref:cation-dependent mannose-6-phosphate receptor-like n=1 Tax=Oratosquilla oratoria TaxID=337810 RepID=UPI003F777241
MAWLKFAITFILCVPEIYGKCVLESESQPNEQTFLNKLDLITGTSLTVVDPKGLKYELVVCGDNKNVTAVQFSSNGKVSLGLSNETSISAGHKWFMTTHYGGDPYKEGNCKSQKRLIHFMFVCDALKSKAKAQFIREGKHKGGCSYMVEVSHPDLCDPEAGLSGSAIFFLLLFIAFGCYFIFGFLYRRLVIGAKGVEQIPNRFFWCRVGNKLADGCDMLLRCDRWCGRRTSGSSYDGYTPIEEELAQDLQDTADRDSTLLSP